MKKIWIPILLLILLILFCLWNSTDKFNKPIDYTIKQYGKAYTVNGDFANNDQRSKIYKTLIASGTNEVNVTTTDFNGFLKDNGSLEVVEKMIPSFVKNYKNGEISFHDNVLTLSGNVSDKSIKKDMDSLLADTKVNYSDNTVVVVPEPIEFLLVQKGNLYDLSGHFANKAQLNQLQSSCESTGKLDSINGTINEELVDKEGALSSALKIIPLFMENYTNGKLEYKKRVLTVSGKVDSEADKALMQSYLSRISNIPTVVNNTTLDMAKIEAAKRAAEQERLAKEKAEQERLAKEKAERERLANEQAEQEENLRVRSEQVRLAKEKAEQEKLAKEKESRNAEQKESTENEKSLKKEVDDLLKHNDIKFRYGSSRLHSSGRHTVDMVAKILKKYPSVNVEIAGHTDNIGSDEYNMKLSQSRVDTVRRRLIDVGVDADRVKSVGYGETKPLYKNTTRRNRRKNRRVEINVIGK